MPSSILTPNQLAQNDQDGYIMVRKLFDDEKIATLRTAIENDASMRSSLYDRKDSSGKSTRMATWNHPGDSVYGLAARSHRVVDTMEDQLGGEVYRYHSKLTAKEPYEGGAWEWHQDYGYWYHNGCVFPYMASVMVALDRSTRENGCLQVVKGPHQCGRIEHGVLPGDQEGADPRRVAKMLKLMPIEYAEMEPGDGLFFHSNVLHRSDQNRSENHRWTVLRCYNAARNNPLPGASPSFLHAARQSRRWRDQARKREICQRHRWISGKVSQSARVKPDDQIKFFKHSFYFNSGPK